MSKSTSVCLSVCDLQLLAGFDTVSGHAMLVGMACHAAVCDITSCEMGSMRPADAPFRCKLFVGLDASYADAPDAYYRHSISSTIRRISKSQIIASHIMATFPPLANAPSSMMGISPWEGWYNSRSKFYQLFTYLASISLQAQHVSGEAYSGKALKIL